MFRKWSVFCLTFVARTIFYDLILFSYRYATRCNVTWKLLMKLKETIDTYTDDQKIFKLLSKQFVFNFFYRSNFSLSQNCSHSQPMSQFKIKTVFFVVRLRFVRIESSTGNNFSHFPHRKLTAHVALCSFYWTAIRLLFRLVGSV